MGMMKKVLVAAALFINTLFGNLASAQGDLALAACALEGDLSPQALGELYQSAFLKIAQRLSLENLRTIEDYAATLSFRLNDETIAKFQNAFTRFGEPNAFATFMKNLRHSDHWKTESRFKNNSVTMTALLAHTLGELDLTEAELATLWFSQLDEESQREEALSVKLANISGAFGDKRPLMAQEFKALIANLKTAECLSSQPDLAQLILNFFRSELASRSSHLKTITIPRTQWPDQKLAQGKEIEVRYKNSEPAFLFKTYRVQRDQINKKTDLEIIHAFHRHFADQDYLVLDKKSGLASFFDLDTRLLGSYQIQTFPGDEINAGGAGIYFYTGQQRDHHYLQALKDQNIRWAFKGQIHVPPNTLVYVLPESPLHHFRIKNRTLTFGAAQVYRPRTAFNHAGLRTGLRPSKFQTFLAEPAIQEFVATLQNEKSQLMALLNIDNDDYNLLAEFSYGVLSPETNYGTSLKYKLKEQIPTIVAILKGKGLDTSANSRGLTQIKRIPKAVLEAYGIDKADLKEARYAAIVTLAFSADLLRELRNMSYLHPAINEENIQDYLYYLYNGRHSEIRKATATPEKNISIRKIKSAIAHLFIEE